MKKKISVRNQIADEYEDVPLMFMDPKTYDAAIIGVIEGKAHELAVAYDYDKVIKINMKDGGTREEAIEWYEFNQVEAYVGKHTPVFVRKYTK